MWLVKVDRGILVEFISLALKGRCRAQKSRSNGCLGAHPSRIQAGRIELIVFVDNL